MWTKVPVAEVLRLLSTKADPNFTDKKWKQRPPVVLATRASRSDLLLQLIEAKVRLERISQCGQGGPVEIKTITSPVLAQAEINKSDGAGMTSLHVAAQAGDAPLIKALLEVGADRMIRLPAAHEKFPRAIPHDLCGETSRFDECKKILAVNLIERSSMKAEKGKDMSDENHVVVSKLCDFICGAQCKKDGGPAPNLKDYMEDGLALNMAKFQGSMYLEVRHAGIEGSVKFIHNPEVIDFWEMDRFFPSSEDATLVVLSIEALCVSRTAGEDGSQKAAMLMLNIYILGNICSGFTLDRVKLVDDQFVMEEHKARSQAHYMERLGGGTEDVSHLEGEHWVKHSTGISTGMEETPIETIGEAESAKMMEPEEIMDANRSAAEQFNPNFNPRYHWKNK